ncbi:hypothetical protein Poli38472_005474 [Pythium oligandrum]|uniref:dolichol kinase n=1 Tax=Pythium oligandrum TaxID=41045 RepID=A0A8K1CG26_PYTOL|nr:hypothetical protein Poli38472_005474 [Pythium oligandrum]|eukprot:TMW62856.1 hypothetical protein Poli38472_005474 [Pythium oligandrum]
MRWKERLRAQHAQATEAFVLLLLVAWVTRETSGYVARAETNATTELLPRMLVWLNVLAIATVFWSLFAREPVPKSMQVLARRERDDGHVIGGVLPVLALLSRFLVQSSGDDSGNGTTLLYAWTCISAGLSTILKIVAFQSSGVIPTLVVDGFLLPIVFSLVSIESGSRFVLPTLCRCLIGFVFHFGRLALPRSFTTGEALIVAQGIGIAVFDLLLVTFSKLDEASRIILPTHTLVVWHVTEQQREHHQLALQVGVIGALLICVALTPLLSSYGTSSPHAVAPPLPAAGVVWFLGTVGSAVVLIVYPWSCLLLDTWNPISWLINFLLEDSARWLLIVYWLACLVIFVPSFAVISRVFKLRQIVARKLFHFLVVLMFVPAFYASPSMLSLSYGVALAIFCLVECIRAVSLPPFGVIIAEFVQSFIDHREAGRVVLTHTYLLLGCAVPLWLAQGSASTNPLAANAGVLALGVGDAMGAVIGSTFGRRKLFGHKTWEGFSAVLLSMLISALGLPQSGFTSPQELGLLVFGLALTSVLEAATAQIDNLVLSLVLFTVANLITLHH